MPEKAKIYAITRNIYGACVIYGSEGVRQYYGYTKEQAIRKYRESGKTLVNRRAKK